MLTVTIEALRQERACGLSERLADFRRCYNFQPREEEPLLLTDWQNLPSTKHEDNVWALRVAKPRLRALGFAKRLWRCCLHAALPIIPANANTKAVLLHEFLTAWVSGRKYRQDCAITRHEAKYLAKDESDAFLQIAGQGDEADLHPVEAAWYIRVILAETVREACYCIEGRTPRAEAVCRVLYTLYHVSAYVSPADRQAIHTLVDSIK